MKDLYIQTGNTRRAALETQCAHCGKTFIRMKNKFKGHGKHYCSKSCASLAQRDRIKLQCATCKKTIYRTPNKIERSATKLFFCSYECADLARKPQNGGLISTSNGKTSLYNYGRHAFEYYEAKCAYCGYSEYKEGLEVHHIDGDRENNDIENLIIVCGTCHALITRGKMSVEGREFKIGTDGVIGNTQS